MPDFRPALQGITLRRWLRLLRGQKIAPKNWTRVLATTMSASLNSLNAWVQQQKFGDQLQEVKIEAPVFILGHWRSGTTMLHELLAADDNLNTPGLYQVWNPHTFLITEKNAAKLTGDRLQFDRGFDRVQLGFSAPSEDEFALWHGSGLSDFCGWTFPENRSHFDRYLTPQQLVAPEQQQWQQEWLSFLKALVVAKPDKTLLLKSPQHTARLTLLHELFPDAKYIHIARHPYRVYQSTLKLHQSLKNVTALGENNWYNDSDFILDRYTRLYQPYFEQRKKLDGDLLEINYEDFVNAPDIGMAKIYDHLGRGLPTNATFKDQMAQIANYKTNHYPELDQPLKQQIRTHCSVSFETWDYQP